MSDTAQNDQLSPLKRAILELREMRAKLAEVELARTEPIAIIGQACRFPGKVDTPEGFWTLVRNGVDAITDMPASRWDAEAYYDPDPDAPGKMYTRQGGFVEGADAFDPQFFAISPREAVSMDPQQRLLLEVSWEALERAGRSPEKLMASRTGVFVGISTADYSFLQLQDGGVAWIDAYFGTGSAASAAAGRLSYVLGLQGPCVAIDTACSSSLVAVHLACQSLRSGECRTALAGGVNLMLRPEITISFCRARMLAADGRCKTFDAAADGYVRGEGCAIVVLKRLSDAIADGDPILAVIRGSAVNQDGRSGGLTVPNGPAQEALIREALAAAGVAPSEVGYVEAHGTGTSLGDPIEVRALGAVLREGRSSDRPLILGSVKTNVGHLEAAAGMAGLIKVVLSLQHGEIPPHLHFKQVNPNISLQEIPAVVPGELMPWPAGPRRIAGLSSFGFTGTNAHLILEQAPVQDEREASADRPLHVLTLSAKSEPALVELARRFGERLASEPSVSLADAAFTANVGRARFADRLAVVAGTAAEAAGILASVAAGEESPGASRGRFSGADRPELAFLFTGQGSQYVGMGRELNETQATFREALARCDEILAPLLPQRLLKVLYADEKEASPLDDTAYTQPALFAVEYALSELWRSWGIEPSAVMGHSVGEYAAACVAGVFSLEDGLRLVAARGRLMGALPSGGGMAAVLASEERVRQAISPYGHQLSIAAVNGRESIVISGEESALLAVAAGFAKEGVRTKRLAVSHAFHSALMDPVLGEFERLAGDVKYSAPKKAFISNLTGRVAGADECGPEYWRRHAREAVRFADGMGTLWAQGYRVFLEVGPAPTLLGMGRQCVTASEAAFIPSIRKGGEDWREMLGSAALLFTRGVDVDWARFDRGTPRRKLALPTYPFERQRYWAERAVSRRPVSRASGEVATHPLLGRRLRSPLITGVVFEAELGIASLPLLGDHRIHGTVVVPAATYVEMALAAAREAWGGDGWLLEDLVIEEALVLPEEGVRAVQVMLTTGEGAGPAFQIASSVEGTDGAEPTWTRQATGRLRAMLPEAERTLPDSEPLLDVKARCPQAVPASAYYAGLRERGFELGPGFQAITGLWRGDGESLAELQLPPEAAADASTYQVHPALFDACCHALGASFPSTDSGEEAYMVLGFKRFESFGPLGSYVWSHATLHPQAGGEGDQETLTGSVRLMDGTGRVVAALEGLQFKRARAEALGRVARESLGDWLYDVAWQPKAGKGGASPGSAADHLLAPDQIAERVRPEIAGLAEAHGLTEYERWLPRIEALAGAYALAAFRQLGWDFRLGQRVTLASLAAELRVADRHRRLLGRMLGVLEEDGIVRAAGGEWEVTRIPPPADPQAQHAELLASFPMATIETSLTGRCGEQLAAVLRGDADPLPLLFPGGSPAAVERIYQDSPGARTFNGLMQKAIAAAIAEAPRDRSLRVLEIGAGTGGTTASVLPVLPADRSLYMFTDVSPAFTQRAADRFQAYPFVRYQLLDIEKDPLAQEIGDQQFDVIIAVNVLHATRRLRDTLGHVRRLLAPEGLLAIMEAIRPMRWLDLTFGLTEGWWRFADEDLRPSHPLLSSSQWRDLLTASGFTGPVALPEATEGGDSLPVQALILARAPRVDVKPKPVARAAAPVAGDWLIFADKSGVGARLADRIREQGGQCVMVLAGEACSADGEDRWRVNPGRPEDFHRLLEEARPAGALPWRAIVHLWSLDASAGESTTAKELEAAQAMGCGSLLHLVQAALRRPASPIWAVTRGAQPVGPDAAAPEVAQSAVWGLGRVVSLEHPELWGGLVDLDAGDADVAVAALLDEIETADGEDQVARRGNARYVARLVRNRGLKTQPARLRPDAAYLITGGLGRIGLKVARWMAEQGARHLVLMGRNGLPDRSAWPALPSSSEAGRQVAAVAGVEALGATVEVVAADASDADQMSAVLARFGQQAPPLRGVIHAAAATGTVALRDMTLEALASVLRPKVAGAWVLHRLTSAMELDFFVMFSSTTGLLGVRDLGHYAAANTFLDALAHYRHSAGRPAVSINWGVWDVLGGASADPQKTFAGAGLRRMASPRALKALGHLMCSDVPQIVVAGVDWATLKPVYEAKRRRPFLEQVGAPTTGRATAPAAKGSDILQRLAAARPQDRWDLLVEHVRGEVAKVLRLQPGRTIELNRGLFDLGMDSLMSVELKSRLEASLGRPLPSTLTFNYPNVGALTDYLAKEALSLQMSPPPEPTNPSAELVGVSAESDDISEDELATQLAEKLAELR